MNPHHYIIDFSTSTTISIVVVSIMMCFISWLSYLRAKLTAERSDAPK